VVLVNFPQQIEHNFVGVWNIDYYRNSGIYCRSICTCLVES